MHLRNKISTSLSLLSASTLLCSSALFCSNIWAADLFVNPSAAPGSGDGSKGSPFQSLESAMDKAAQINQDGVTIHLAAGMHFLDQTIKLDASHSGKEGAPITIKGAPNHATSLSGGIVIDGWKPSSLGNGIFEAPVPEDARFAELYINGRYGIRARFPDGNGQIKNRSFVEGLVDNKFYICIPKESLADHPEIKFDGAEGFLRQRWAGSRYIFDKEVQDPQYDDQGMRFFTIKGEYANTFQFGNAKFWTNQIAGWTEGHISMLNQENEWHLDEEKDILYYKPPASVNLQEAEVIAPNVEILFYGDDLSYVNVEGIVFEHSRFTLHPERKFVFTAQASMINDITLSWAPATETGNNDFNRCLPAHAVEFNKGKKVRFSRNVVRNAGGGGLAQLVGGEDIEIIGNAFTNIGGNGVSGAIAPNYGLPNPNHRVLGKSMETMYFKKHKIMEREKEAYGELPIAKNITISDNYFSNIGTRLFSAVGVGFYFADGLKINHNEFFALCYQAVHTGWNKDKNIGRLKDVEINNNDIHNYLWVNNDGGAIHNVNHVVGNYMVTGNHIHNIAPGDFRGGVHGIGVYLDNGTTNATVKHNVSEYLMGDINNIYTRPKHGATFKRYKDELDLFVSIIEENHGPQRKAKGGKNFRDTVDGVLPEAKVKEIIETAGPRKDYQDMRQFAAPSTVWEGAKEGNRYDLK